MALAEGHEIAHKDLLKIVVLNTACMLVGLHNEIAVKKSIKYYIFTHD